MTETLLLTSIRRLPADIVSEHAGEERISYEQFLTEKHNKFFVEGLDEDGFFSTIEDLAAYTKNTFEPASDSLEVPYTLRPCKHVRLEAPSARQILIDAYEDQDAPDHFDVESDGDSLQELLDWWFKHNTKGWWAPDEDRVIVLLPAERKKIFELVTGQVCGSAEPDREVIFGDEEDELELAATAGDARSTGDDAPDIEDEEDEEAPPSAVDPT